MARLLHPPVAAVLLGLVSASSVPLASPSIEPNHLVQVDTTDDPSAVAEDPEAGFLSMLNGKDLSGWKPAKDDDEAKDRFLLIDETTIRVYSQLENGAEAENDHLFTTAEYSRYVFRMEYRWVGPRFGARSDRDREAGLLFHVASESEEEWPPALEFQIGDSSLEAGDDLNKWMTGDLWVHGQDLSVAAHTKNGHYDPGAPIQRIGSGKQREANRVSAALEKPTGEWNEIELTVLGGESVEFKVNGQVANHMIDLRDGEELLTRGRISLEAKWAAIDFRNPRIKTLPDPKGEKNPEAEK